MVPQPLKRFEGRHSAALHAPGCLAALERTHGNAALRNSTGLASLQPPIHGIFTSKPRPLPPPIPCHPKLLDTQAELQAVQEAAAVREGELREQVERLRREKRELEARAGGVDLQAAEVCAGRGL